MRLQDLTGRKFGLLTINKRIPTPNNKNHKKTWWLATCECGRTREVYTSLLKVSKNISCNHIECKRKYQNPQNATINYIIDSYKRNAKRFGRKWSLSNDQAKKFFLDKCYYCLSEPYNIRNVYKNSKQYDVSEQWGLAAAIKLNGIDRVDNNLDYTIDNCVSCCKMCNSAKSDFTIHEFITWLKKIKNNIDNLGIGIENGN